MWFRWDFIKARFQAKKLEWKTHFWSRKEVISKKKENTTKKKGKFEYLTFFSMNSHLGYLVPDMVRWLLTPTTLHRGAWQNHLPVETHPRLEEAIPEMECSRSKIIIYCIRSWMAPKFSFTFSYILSSSAKYSSDLLYVCPSVNPSVHLTVHPSVRLSFRPSVCLSLHPSIRPFFRLFFCLSFLCPSVHQSNNNGSKKLCLPTDHDFPFTPSSSPTPLPLSHRFWPDPDTKLWTCVCVCLYVCVCVLACLFLCVFVLLRPSRLSCPSVTSVCHVRLSLPSVTSVASVTSIMVTSVTCITSVSSVCLSVLNLFYYYF